MSFTTTGFFPAAAANRTTVSTVSDDVNGPLTISASFITGAGEAQCQPTIRSGLSVAAPRAAIENPEELLAKIV